MASKSIGMLNIVFGADLRGFERAMKKAQKNIKRFGSSMKRTGANMTRNITMPVLALGGVAIKTFADFEQAMLKVKAVSGATGSEFESLKDKAKALGSSTMFTASEVAGLQLELAKLGFTTDQINTSTESILQLSQATGHDLAQSGEIVASTLNSFSMETTEATKVADIFALASSSAAIDMEKLSVAMPTVGSTAAAVGIPLEELTAQMMVLADRGMEASTMGTHLRKIFVELATKGISYEDAMAKINASTNKVKTATDLFGKRAFAAGLILAKNTDQTKKYREEIDAAGGTSKEMAEIMDSGVGGALRRLKSQAEGVAIELGESLIPIFSKLLTGVKDLLGWWSGLDGSMKNSIVAFGILAAALGPIVSFVGTLAVAFSALISPIGLAVTAVVGLVVAFAYVRENWEAFKERLGDWSWWRNALISAVQFLVKINPLNLLIESYNKIAGFFGKAEIPFDFVTDWLEDMKVETKEYENEFGSFKDAMLKTGGEIMSMFGDFNLGKTIGVGGVGGGGGKEDEEGDGPLLGNTEQAFETYQEYLESLIEPTEETLTSLQQFWVDFFASVSDGLEKMGEELGANLQSGAEDFHLFGEKVKESIRGVIKGLIGEGVAAAIRNALATTAITPWMIPIVAGAAAGLATTAFNQLVPAFAQGGLVTGPTLGLIGEGSGTSAFNPEVVSPLDKLMGMMGGGSVDVHGRIKGENIVLVSDKAEISRERFI